MNKVKIFSNYRTVKDLENAINEFVEEGKTRLISVSMFTSGELYKYGAAVIYLSSED